MAPVSLSGLDPRDLADIVAQSQPHAASLRDARIVVTGATGWFGTWLLDALVALDRAHELDLSIVAISRDPAAFARRHPALHAASAITWVAADVRDASPAVSGSVTHVVHAATDASARLNAEAPDLMFDTIVRGTTNVLRLAAAHRGVRMLLVSSGAVYGAQPSTIERLEEGHPGIVEGLDPAGAYAEGKRAAELLASIWHAKRGVHVAIARCFAFVGPHMPLDAHFAIGNFIRDAVHGDDIVVAGDGRPRRSYLYMSDLVAWLLAILCEGAPVRPYNVGAEDAVTIATLAARCAAVAKRPVEVRILQSTAGGADYVPSTARARRELRVAARVPLDDAIARTAAWARINLPTAVAA